MPTQSDLEAVQLRVQARKALFQNQRAINLETLQDATTPNDSYENEFAKYRAWVSEQDELDNLPVFSRVNVDHYFTRVVAYRKGQPKNGRKVVSALQWFCKYRFPSTEFAVESPSVLEALRLQKARGESTGNPGGDPLRGLKDAVPESDRVLMMKYIYRSRNDWDTASVNFAWGYQAAVRGASNRKLTFSDMNLSFGLGAEKEGSLAWALLVVMRKGGIHKDRHDKDQQVCAWRHKQYVLCAVFATAARVIWTLCTRGDTIEFYQRDKRQRAEWWDIPLIDWEEYNGECDMF